ncbi:MAG: hypothetical protein ACREP6_11160 [Candidatus Binataceae bacterium]
MASNLAPNQTAAWGDGHGLIFTYTQNFDCVDQPTDDLNFNGILMQSDSSEIQTPICQVGDAPTEDPTGLNVRRTDKLYVIVPFFSLNNDQNPNDALACPPGVRPDTLCGPQLGATLIQLFGAIPEGFKTNPLVTVQCPNPGAPPGTCTTHASSLDLFPALVALGKLPATPKMNIFVPTPNHSHVINMDLAQRRSVWWQVIVDLITDPADWPAADGTSGITSVNALRQAQKDGGALPDVPTNFFLFFGSQRVHYVPAKHVDP